MPPNERTGVCEETLPYALSKFDYLAHDNPLTANAAWQVPFRRYLCHLFTIAFDLYLDILHHVDTRVANALGRNTPTWRLKNICPACMYETEGEPAQQYKKLFCMDGNNSLKSVDDALRSGVPRDDSRKPRRDIWLHPDEVNRFAREEPAKSGKVSLR